MQLAILLSLVAALANVLTPGQVAGTEDAAIYEGRLYATDTGFEFRQCGKEGRLPVDAQMPIFEFLDTYLQSQTSQAPVYIRFHGEQVVLEYERSGRRTDAVRITEVLAHSSTVPVRCE